MVVLLCLFSSHSHVDCVCQLAIPFFPFQNCTLFLISFRFFVLINLENFVSFQSSLKKTRAILVELSKLKSHLLVWREKLKHNSMSFNVFF